MIEMSTIFNLCNNNTDTNKYDNEIKFQNLLNDYVHNLSNNVRHMNDFEWYFNDSYYSDICGNGNPNENNINRGDVNSFNSGNSSMNSSSMFKNKNTVYEKKEKTTIFKNPLECNECKNENVQNENVQNENVQNENVQNENVQISYNNSELKDNSGSELKDNLENKFKSFHLAEGPGGFIEAVAHIRKNKKDEYYGMTLVNNDTKCPGWRNSKKFLEDNPNVIIEKGVDKTGNLLSRDNFIHCYDKYKNSMDLVTGDGGIDFSEDFNNQEYSATKLIIAQVVYALTLQSNDGNFVLKVFDTFSNAIIDVLYLLSSLYKSVYIMKPQTSRNANSERYIICKGYNLNENKERIDYIIEKIYDNFDNLNSSLYIETIFNFKNNRTFISKIEEINIIIGKKQIDNILTTLNIMMNKKFDKMDYYKKKHIQKCIRWCEIFDINFNKNLKSTNIFLSSTIEK
jgi:23S rRNA U2552 (ribose-2'-O)-methylase RlmE/FtsJ